MKNGSLLAAIDLGSNSFRLEICRYSHGLIQRVEYIKETVRQGSGLDEDRNLSLEALERGWDCLSRFAERLAGFKSNQVRAVATQTLREAKNRKVFLDKAHRILGFPIEVVSGREEARLIYQGVTRLLPLRVVHITSALVFAALGLAAIFWPFLRKISIAPISSKGTVTSQFGW